MPGRHTLQVAFSGGGGSASSTTLDLSVARAVSRVRATGPKQVEPGARTKVEVRVSASGVVPTGRVRLTLRGRTVDTATLEQGSQVLTVPGTALRTPGRKVLVVTYAGSARVAGDKDRLVVIVRR